MKEFKPILWTFSDIVNALNLKEDFDVFPAVKTGEEGRYVFLGVSTDSRSIKNDELFLALKGENFNGHDFIEKLADQGIKGFVVEAEFFDDFVKSIEKTIKKNGITLFKVDNTVKALGMLAKFQRIRSKVKLVAITGSNGKTSTRQMTAEIFKTRFNTLTTKGNFNNEIGVPLTLLKLSSEHQWAVVEMGMNHKGELSGLSAMVAPDIAIVTNTAKAHLEGLGTVLDVAEAKAEIFDFVVKGGTAIINCDDKRWKIIAEKAEKSSGLKKIILTGISENASIRAESIKHISQKTCFDLVAENFDSPVNICVTDHGQFANGKRLQGAADARRRAGERRSTKVFQMPANAAGAVPCERLHICLDTPADFMVANALAAAAAGLTAGLSGDEIKKGLEAFTPVSGRMTILKSSKGFHIIDDTYNANPSSVKGALETLAELSGEQSSFAVLGDMLELGENTAQLHFETGMQAAFSGVSRLYVYGNMAEHIASGAVEAGLEENRIMKGEKKEIVADILHRKNQPAWILVKGSRGMKMEEVVAGLR